MEPIKVRCRHYFFGLITVSVLLCSVAQSRSHSRVTTFAGGREGNGGAAASASFAGVTSVVRDAKGNLYIADSGHCRVRKVNTKGDISTFVGTAKCGYNGDGLPRLQTMISNVSALAFDLKGDLLISDQGNQRVRRIAEGVVTNVAGNGTSAYSGDGGPATEAGLSVPAGICVDSLGNLYIADFGNEVIRMIDPSGTIHTVAGNHKLGFGGDNGPATAAELNGPQSIVVDGNGNLYIGDTNNKRVRRVDNSGMITTYAGTGTNGNSGNGGPAILASIGNPFSLLLSGGNLLVGTPGNIWAINSGTNLATIVAGTASPVMGFNGDGKPALSTQLTYVEGIATDNAGDFWIADFLNDRVRLISGNTQIVSTVAGGYIGDGGTARSASFNFYNFGHTAFDTAGNFYVADSYNNRIRKVSATGIITTYAGTGVTGFGGNGGPATSATLAAPRAVAADPLGNVYIADESGQLRKIDPSGTITAFSNVLALNFDALTTDQFGNVYATDGTSAVWKITPEGTATIIAGVQFGVGEYNGDNIPATEAQLSFPNGVAVDRAGNVYISDMFNYRIRKVDTQGIITTVAGTGTPGYSGDGQLATNAMISIPQDVAVDDEGNLYIADWFNGRVRMVNSSGIIETIAGTGTWGFNGDGLPPTETNLAPVGITVKSGDIYVTDAFSYRIRKVR